MEVVHEGVEVVQVHYGEEKVEGDLKEVEAEGGARSLQSKEKHPEEVEVVLRKGFVRLIVQQGEDQDGKQEQRKVD